MDERKLLIADDSELNRAILVSVLEKNFDILEAADGKEAIATLAAHEGNIAALLLDVVMPEADGFEVLEEMNRRGWIDEIPTIMISVETGGSYIDRAFQLGAADYVSRPFVPNMIRRRVINAILLHTKTRKLTGLIADHFYRRERNTDILAAILGYAVEARSGERGTHMTNVSRITGLLLHRLLERTDRCPIGPEDIETVCIASSLHDIGKLLIPEGILTKPTALTPGEFDIVKQHTRLGAKIISDLPIYQNETIIKYALEICRWHHERWNGEGYPDGLKGEDIPIAAQVVSLADAYDALTSKRCYKEALSHEKSLEMIRGGECGNFNPLLLECLNDIADTLKHSAGAEAAAEPPAYRWAKELIWKPDGSRQELSSARMTKQVEQELSKRRFFSDLTEEFWFEFTRHPDAVALSAGAARRTGLPRVIVGPLSCTQLCSVVSADTIQAMRNRLLCATSDETYLEFETELTLDGHPSLCQIAIQITWASDEPGRFSSLFGRVLDIGERCRRLEDYRQAFAAPVLHPALLPVTVGADHVLRITGEQVIGVLESCRSMFGTVRLVDPEICMQLTDTSDGAVVEKSEHCYAIWNKTQRCEHCISQEVIRTRRAQTKVEAVGDKVFYVHAVCVEVDGTPYALELVSPIRMEDLRGDEDASVLNQLLLRNRQVYIDSATHVYNRRYFDDRLRDLDGEFTLAMLDLDHFKHINDKYGHSVGDEVLKQFAEHLQNTFRFCGFVGRIGGDEFVLLCPARQPEELAESLAAFRHTIREMGYEVSVGVSESTDRQTLNETVNRAETAMRHDKMEFYRNNGGIRQMRIIDDKLKQLLIKKQDVTRFLQAIAPLYRGVYMVNAKRDTCRYIYVPSYFKTMLENNHHAFMSSVREYCRELVHPEYHDEFAKLLDYSYIEEQIAAHGSLKMTYQIRDGSRVHLKITMADRSSADVHELLWIFLDETQ